MHFVIDTLGVASFYFIVFAVSLTFINVNHAFRIHLWLTDKGIEHRRVIMHPRILFFVFPSSSCFAPFFCLRLLLYHPPLFCTVVFGVRIPLPQLLRTIAHYRSDRDIRLWGHQNSLTHSRHRVHLWARCPSTRPPCIHRNCRWPPTGSCICIFYVKCKVKICKLTVMLAPSHMWFTNLRGPKNTRSSEPCFCR